VKRRFNRPQVGVLGYGDLVTSLVLVAPLFFIYEIGVMFSDSVNGADFVTRLVFDAVGRDVTKYLIVHLVLALVFIGVVLFMRRGHAIYLRRFPLVVAESAVWALTMGSFIVLVMDRVLGFELLALGDVGNKIFVSIGAGVHEELVFRLGLMAGGAGLLRYLGLKTGVAVMLSALVSSVLFSAAHHVGPLGDPWEVQVFTYRFLAGLFFGALFYFRSFGHAVYTHFLYDVVVLVFRGGG